MDQPGFIAEKILDEVRPSLCYRGSMKVVITGGGGFLGFQLALRIQKAGTLTDSSGAKREVEEICLFDRFFSPAVREKISGNLTMTEGEISDRDAVFQVIDRKDAAIFHLASMVSGECEQRFDDALAVNLQGGSNVFEAARALRSRPRVVFASSIACFGGPDLASRTMDDWTKRTPRTTYGMTKVIGELMVNDYSRKGFFDGRSARLPTVIIRPGRPNAAASSWASGMFREPLNGEDCRLPVRRDQRHPMTGYREVIESFLILHELDEGRLGQDRAVQLPAHSVSPNDAEAVVREVAAERGRKTGSIVEAFDPVIQGIVDQWPTAVDGRRGVGLGLPQPAPLREIVSQYLQDFCP